MPVKYEPTVSTTIKAGLSPLLKDASELLAIALVGSVPLIGPALVLDRKTLARLSSLFESDDSIHRDVNKVVQNMAEVEEIMLRLKSHIERRRSDLQKTLDEYKRFSKLAKVQRKNAQPLLAEFRKEGNKGIIWGVVTNLVMVILGIVLAHFLRIWIPNFNF